LFAGPALSPGRSLFPRDFDAAIPVIKHKDVDKLLMQVRGGGRRAELVRGRPGLLAAAHRPVNQ
jgi:hypothetical protein